MKDEFIIEPTGTCFEDVTWEFARRTRENIKCGIKMVHGICLKADGKPYAHAWIEEGMWVWFSGYINGEFCFAKTWHKEFYREYQVQEYTAYTLADLIRLAEKVGNAPPPWEEKYLKLCKDYKGKK